MEHFHFIAKNLRFLWFEVISACGYIVPQMFLLYLYLKSVSSVWSFTSLNFYLFSLVLLFLFRTTYEHGDCRTVQRISTSSSAHFGIFGIAKHVAKSSSAKNLLWVIFWSLGMIKKRQTQNPSKNQKQKKALEVERILKKFKSIKLGW